MASCYHNTWKMGRISVASIREVNTAVFFVDVDLFVFFFFWWGAEVGTGSHYTSLSSLKLDI